MLRTLLVTLLITASLQAADWVDITPKPDLAGWEKAGDDGVWTVLADGTLVGQRDLLSARKHLPEFANPASWQVWLNTQAWLYTTKEYGPSFDFEIDYWLRYGGNSGISIGDKSRAKYAVSNPPDFTKTPARKAYEIQMNNLYPDPHPSGSIYNFVDAPKDSQKDNEWNHMLIEVRPDIIRVFINGKKVAENPGAADRPKDGPIGIQLHDRFSVSMYRHIRIREVGK